LLEISVKNEQKYRQLYLRDRMKIILGVLE